MSRIVKIVLQSEPDIDGRSTSVTALTDDGQALEMVGISEISVHFNPNELAELRLAILGPFFEVQHARRAPLPEGIQ